MYNINFFSDSDLIAYSSAYFGQGTGDIAMDDVQCVGNETALTLCPHTTDHNCGHFEDAGVRCSPCESHFTNLTQYSQYIVHPNMPPIKMVQHSSVHHIWLYVRAYCSQFVGMFISDPITCPPPSSLTLYSILYCMHSFNHAH